MGQINLKSWFNLFGVAVLLSGCALANKQAAFELESPTTAVKDDKGYPRIVGAYDRKTPLPRNIERKTIEADLKAAAANHQSHGRGVNAAANQRESDRLIKIARTHGAKAQKDILKACQTDAKGIVTCKTN